VEGDIRTRGSEEVDGGSLSNTDLVKHERLLDSCRELYPRQVSMYLSPNCAVKPTRIGRRFMSSPEARAVRLTRGRKACKRSPGVLTFLVVLRANPSETLLDLLVMFTKQRGTRHGIYDCDRRGGFAVLSASLLGGWIVKSHDRGGKNCIYRVLQSSLILHPQSEFLCVVGRIYALMKRQPRKLSWQGSCRNQSCSS
jgi:hypothetical protein